jgi:hypothetical protein
MNIPFRGSLTYEQFRHAMQLHLKVFPNPLSIQFMVFAIVLIISLGVGIVISPSRALPVLGYLGIVVLVILLLSKVTESSARETWLNNETLREPQEGTIMTSGIETRKPTSLFRIVWSHCKYHLISEDIVIIYNSPISFGIYPKSFFANVDEWNEFIQVVEIRVSSTLPPTWRTVAATRAAWVSTLFIGVLTIGIAMVFSF